MPEVMPPLLESKTRAGPLFPHRRQRGTLRGVVKFLMPVYLVNFRRRKTLALDSCQLYTRWNPLPSVRSFIRACRPPDRPPHSPTLYTYAFRPPSILSRILIIVSNKSSAKTLLGECVRPRRRRRHRRRRRRRRHRPVIAAPAPSDCRIILLVRLPSPS